MSVKYHINPETHEVGICSAKYKCDYGENASHYTSMAEAHQESVRRLDEEYNGGLNSMSKKAGGFFSGLRDKANAFLDKEMKKEFGTTDLKAAQEMNKARYEGRRVAPNTIQESTSTVKSEVVDGSDAGEYVEGEIIDE